MRTVSLVSVVILAGVVAGCQTQPVKTAASVAAACTGDDFVEVTNNTGKAVEVYADVGNAKDQYIGTMAPDSTHLSLRGTVAQGKSAAFYATLDGVKYQQADGDATPVQVIRRCGR